MSTASWTLLTNHAHVLVCIARDPGVSMRAIGQQVGVTERAVQRLVRDLVDGGYLQRERAGRRNSYRLDTAHPLRHPLEQETRLRDLLALLTPDAAESVGESGQQMAASPRDDPGVHPGR